MKKNNKKKINKKNIILLIIIMILLIILQILYKINYISHKKYTNEYFNIIEYKSKIDKDNDNIVDNIDILENAYTYINTKPKYKSKYYANGYPDDEYGVCTDVVAFSMLNAGYDLMELVNKDIKENKELYNIETIDKNIDFRRVKNLKIYFDRNSIKLTNNLFDYDKWQPGDIVIFPGHIGIISKYRNSNKIPFLIHNANPYQKYYEEDVLENYKIIGHYRIS